MGVKFNREYNEIIDDLSTALNHIGDCYRFLEISSEDWNKMDEADRKECIRTLADDIFYGLGAEPELQLETGSVSYDKNNHVIKVSTGENIVSLVYLI